MKRDSIRKMLVLNAHYPFKRELCNSISSFASSDLKYHSKPEDSDYKRMPHASLLKSSLIFKCALVKLQDRFQRRWDVSVLVKQQQKFTPTVINQYIYMISVINSNQFLPLI